MQFEVNKIKSNLPSYSTEESKQIIKESVNNSAPQNNDIINLPEIKENEEAIEQEMNNNFEIPDDVGKQEVEPPKKCCKKLFGKNEQIQNNFNSTEKINNSNTSTKSYGSSFKNVALVLMGLGLVAKLF